MDTAQESSSSNNMMKFLDVLISEIKIRPVLWDRRKFRHEHYGNRRKVTEQWNIVASILNKSPDEVKAKWRNLKDTFHREEKKLQLPLVNEGKPLISYYTGQWDKFEKLLFLHNTRSHTRSYEEYIETNVSEICIDNIKIEFEASENSNDNDPLLEEDRLLTLNNNVRHSNVAIEDSTNMFPTTSFETDPNSDTDPNSSHYEVKRKRLLDNTSDEVANKKPNVEMAINMDIDEEMLVKALVPFLRKLNPVRKLMVRNELQNLLLKELLCEQCRNNGFRPDCRCNLN